MSYQVRIGAYLTGFGGLLCCLSTFPGINSMVNSLIEPTPLYHFNVFLLCRFQSISSTGWQSSDRWVKSIILVVSHRHHASQCFWSSAVIVITFFHCYRSLGTDWSRLSLHLRSANENLPTLARPSHDQSSSSSISSYLSSSSSSSSS